MFKIKMAELVIEIDNKYDFIKKQCKNYICESNESDLTISVNRKEIQKEANGTWFYNKGYCESLAVYRKIALKLPLYDGMLFHGAAVALDGEAYLFLAKSGTGKTTHVSLWKKVFGERAEIINGDKPIVRKINSIWQVCGTPWCGKEGFSSNKTVPLKAICFLERGTENEIKPIEISEITKNLFNRLLIPKDKESSDSFFELINNLIDNISFYHLKCNMEADAAVISYNGMKDRFV